MGRASNRKKAQRQAGGPNLRRIKQDTRSPAVTQGLPFDLGAMVQFAGERVRRRSIALQAWLGDTEPTSARLHPGPKALPVTASWLAPGWGRRRTHPPC